MKEIIKKLLKVLLPALIGSGITIAISDGLSVQCKPVITESIK